VAARPADTDWPQIVRLYDLLERLTPSPVVSLNRAVAVAMAEGPTPGLALIDELAAELDGYYLLQPSWGFSRSGGQLHASARFSHQRQRAAVSGAAPPRGPGPRKKMTRT
jgi:RNA polymerase sigma-70 factor (ECF subfamily)